MDNWAGWNIDYWQMHWTHRNFFQEGVHIAPFSLQELVHEYHIALFGTKSWGGNEKWLNQSLKVKEDVMWEWFEWRTQWLSPKGHLTPLKIFTVNKCHNFHQNNKTAAKISGVIGLINPKIRGKWVELSGSNKDQNQSHTNYSIFRGTLDRPVFRSLSSFKTSYDFENIFFTSSSNIQKQHQHEGWIISSKPCLMEISEERNLSESFLLQMKIQLCWDRWQGQR